jgi:Asp-tRNA(Asn)/Glu-tRNA(Gln) amidotransferase A subunit family amidase
MAGFAEYEAYDGLGLAELVRRREITPEELLGEALARAERLNPTLNAFPFLFEERAHADIRAGLPEGPFTGVPFALKDLFMLYAGERTANGSRFWADFVAPHDSELFARYRRAGLVIFGKTNTPELRMSPSTEPALFGATRNPWNLGRTTGGSSGGSAAAVAAGILPLAHGSDSGGSIRIPASCCGLFGLKPTRGRMPMGPDRGESSGGLGTAHAITRSVRDSATLLDGTAGPDLGAPYGIAPPARPWSEEVGAPPGRLRVALATAPPRGGVAHPECIAAADDAARLCEALGHVVEEAMPTIDYSAIASAAPVIFAGSVRALVDRRASTLGRQPSEGDLEGVTWAIYQRAERFTAGDYANALAAIHRAGRDLASFQERFDVVLMPTLAQPPVPLGEIVLSHPDPDDYFARSMNFSPYTVLANAAGVPAMSVPLYWSGDGLPIGVQFIARFGDEATLFRLAAQLGSARPWANRRPLRFS